MSVRPSCDHVAAQLDPPLGLTYRDVRNTERRFKLVRDLVETAAFDGYQAGNGPLVPFFRLKFRKLQTRKAKNLLMQRHAL